MPQQVLISPIFRRLRHFLLGLYLRIVQPGWASDALEVSYIPQGLFDTLLSSLRLLLSLLCNRVSMRQLGCTAPLLYRGACQQMCAQTVLNNLGIGGILLAYVPIRFAKPHT